ncbi:hypothetical protein GR11A_00249 [Vibrio phage vB_VcorM_GR11A]|nr:hypothetical protein GR11A_00249 [Vibrio phage vB_VcorM_GR11A]
MIRLKNRARVRTDKSTGRHTVTSSYQSISSGGGAGGHPLSRAAGGGASTKDCLLDGIIKQDPDTMRSVYMDLYMHDAVSGGAVDLLSMLPWSDYSLSGADDKTLDIYNESLERLNVVELMPELSLDYFVLGAFCGTSIYSSDVKGFTDLIPHSIASCTIEETPLYSVDPKITLNVPDEMKNFAKSKDPYMQRLQQRMGPHILNAMQSNEVTLDPLTTLYVPRTSFSTVQTGLSIYQRVVPIYLLERLLYRGTLTEATRRQRSTLHVTAGDDIWEPDADELQQIVALFQQAELDPVSSIVATQQNIATNEIRAAGDFWKWTDIQQETNDMKMRALGINEAFLTGDATYNTMDVAMSVFVEQLRSFREMVTRKLFTSKIFPILAVVHDFKRTEKDQKKAEARFRETAQSLTQDFNFQINDSHSLMIPEVNWHKHLRPEADREYLDVLDSMAEKGIPVSLRMWAAAGGINLDGAIDGMEEDKAIREKIAEKGGVPGLEGDDFGEGDDGDDFSLASTSKSNLIATGGVKRKSLMNRDYGESGEVVGRTKTGKKKYIYNQTAAKRKENDAIMKSLERNSDPNHLNKSFKKAQKFNLVKSPF